MARQRERSSTDDELVGVGEIVKRTGLAMHNVRSYTYDAWHPAPAGRFSGRRVWRWRDVERALIDAGRWDGTRHD